LKTEEFTVDIQKKMKGKRERKLTCSDEEDKNEGCEVVVSGQFEEKVYVKGEKGRIENR